MPVLISTEITSSGTILSALTSAIFEGDVFPSSSLILTSTFTFPFELGISTPAGRVILIIVPASPASIIWIASIVPSPLASIWTISPISAVVGIPTLTSTVLSNSSLFKIESFPVFISTEVGESGAVVSIVKFIVSLTETPAPFVIVIE